MRAVRVHSYGKRPSVDDIPEPEVSGPLDVLVEVGAAVRSTLTRTRRCV